LLPYWLLFALWSISAVQTERRRGQETRTIFFVAAVVGTTLMIGLRYVVGGDWSAYQRMYDDISFLSLPAATAVTDPGYAAVNWLAVQVGGGMPLVNLICATLFMGGFARLAWRQPNPALAVLVAVPYFIIVVAMGYTRQATAIGILCFALADASERKILRLVVLVGIATLFHKTAILFLPILLVPVITKNFLLGLFGAVAFAILFTLFLGASSDRLVTNYVTSNYNSSGAAIRVTMNVVAGVLMLMFRNRMGLDNFSKSFWTICAVMALVSVPALVVSSASSGIDRLALFLIPLQVVTFSRLPYALSRLPQPLPSILLGVIAYSFAVQFVWLNYAENADSWLPYDMAVTSD
jgi:hypothetical protein